MILNKAENHRLNGGQLAVLRLTVSDMKTNGQNNSSLTEKGLIMLGCVKRVLLVG